MVIEIILKIFKNTKFQISRKSVQWKPHSSVRMDKLIWRC